MHFSAQVLVVIPLLLLVGLICVAGIATYRIRSLALPISNLTAAATIILPIVMGMTVQGTWYFARRSHRGLANVKLRYTLGSAVFLTLLVVYETIIATLGLVNMTSPSDLKCRLEVRWSWLFSEKMTDEIRRIQDRHQCCGLNSVRDRAWPFPDRTHSSTACLEAFGRNRSCIGSWTHDHRITASLMLLVAVVTFLLQLALIVIYRSRMTVQSSTESSFPALVTNGNDLGGNVQDRVGDTYQDDPLPEIEQENADLRSIDGDEDRAGSTDSVLQPSRFRREESGWGDR